MRTIEQQTIERHQRLLRVLEDLVGKEADLQKIVRAFNLPNSTLSYARKLGFLNYSGNKILKVNYRNPDPIIARRLVEGVNKIKRDNSAKKSGLIGFKESKLPELKLPEPKPVQEIAKTKEVFVVKKEPKITKHRKAIVKIFGLRMATIELL